MSFLHGISFSTDNGLSPAKVANFSIVGITGTAGMGPVNVPTVVISEDEGVRIFGTEGTIGKALKRHFAKGPKVGYVVVVNVGTETNPLVHVTNETVSFTEDQATLAHQAILIGSTLARAGATITGTGVGTLHTLTDAAKSWTPHEHIGKHLYDVDGTYYLVTENDATTLTVAGTPRSGAYQLMSSTIYWENVDYVVDYNEGFITRVAGHIPEDTITMQMYDYYTGGQLVTIADIIGGVDPDTGLKNGIHAMLDAETVTGYKPKLLIAPEWSSAQGVMDALIEMADLLKGRAIGACAVGATKEEAKAYRDKFNNVNATIVYPTVKYLADDGITEVVGCGSTEVAAVWSRLVNEYGYWYSPSNHPVENVLATERPIDYIYDSALCTASYLNENGITTFVKRDGTFYVWGNLSATTDGTYAFSCVQITRQHFQEAFVAVLLSVLDLPMNRAWFENITDTMTVLMNGSVGKAITAGSFKFLADDNPPEKLRLGKATARWKWTPTYPGQEVDVIETVDVAELAQLFSA